MTRITTLALIVMVGLTLGGAQAGAAVRGAPNLVQLGAVADTIVVGTVGDDAVVLAGSSNVNLTLSVDRVLKGSLQRSSDLPVVWVPEACSPPADVTYIRGMHALFFVRRAPTGQWQLIPPFGSAERFEDMVFPVPSGPLDLKYSYPVGVSVAGKLLLELGAAVASTSVKSASLSFMHWTPVDKSLDSVTRRIYENWANSSDDNTKMFGLAGLVRQGDGAALALAAQTVRSHGSRTPQLWALALAIREYFRNPLPADLSTLSGLTGNVPLDVRRAAAYALAAIHSRDSLPFLARLLDSDDPDIRSFGVGGLAMFANNVAMITITNSANSGMQPQTGDAPYRTDDTMRHFTIGSDSMRLNEAYYVTFWKEWWEKHEAKLAR